VDCCTIPFWLHTIMALIFEHCGDGWQGDPLCPNLQRGPRLITFVWGCFGGLGELRNSWGETGNNFPRCGTKARCWQAVCRVCETAQRERLRASGFRRANTSAAFTECSADCLLGKKAAVVFPLRPEVLFQDVQIHCRKGGPEMTVAVIYWTGVPVQMLS